jgi:hypothetical protein
MKVERRLESSKLNPRNLEQKDIESLLLKAF